MALKLEEKNLIGLDFLRFILSITILIYHFPHFSFPFMDLESLDFRILPFSSFLSLSYKYGDFAVQIFWMISGVIFFHFYSSSINDGKTTFYKFLYYRFSRLYPLHFVTLLCVAGLQFLYYSKFGQAFINPANDVIHFFLNLLMINYWSSNFGLSFNGPFWSVSIEIFVYIIFFLLAYVKLLNRAKYTLIIVAVFFVVYSLGILNPFHECLLYFFAGCLIAQNFDRIKLKQTLFLAVIVGIGLMLKYWTPIINHINVVRVSECFIKLNISGLFIIVFMGTFSRVNQKGKGFFRELGNMTYAMYMIHYSIQIIFILILFKRGKDFFNSNTFFLSYIACTILLGYLTYRFFESPAQNLLRKTAGVKK